MQTRLHMSCIEMDVLPCDWAYDAPKISWTHIKSCAGLDNDNEATSHIALFVLSLIETQKKNCTWCMVSLSWDTCTYLVNTRKYPSLTIQFFVKVLLHSVVQEASVSWRLWFGKWVFYFHWMLHITYQVLEVLWPLTLSAKMWSRDLGSLLLASNGDSGILHNCWCLECCFSVRSTFPQLAMMKIQMIFTELITIRPSLIHKKLLPNYLNLTVRPPCKEGDPYENYAYKVQYLKFANGWWYSKQTWIVSSSIGSSHFTDIPCSPGVSKCRT